MRRDWADNIKRIREGLVAPHEARHIIRQATDAFEPDHPEHVQMDKQERYYREIAVALCTQTALSVLAMQDWRELPEEELAERHATRESWQSLVKFHAIQAGKRNMPVVAGMLDTAYDTYSAIIGLRDHKDQIESDFRDANAFRMPLAPAQYFYRYQDVDKPYRALHLRTVQLLLGRAPRSRVSTPAKDQQLIDHLKGLAEKHNYLGWGGAFGALGIYLTVLDAWQCMRNLSFRRPVDKTVSVFDGGAAARERRQKFAILDSMNGVRPRRTRRKTRKFGPDELPFK